MIRSNFETLRRTKGLNEKRDLSLRQVSKETGLAKATILRIKAEYPERVDCTTLDKLCTYFDCELGALLQRVPDQEKE